MLAAQYGREGVVSVLVEAGVDLDAKRIGVNQCHDYLCIGAKSAPMEMKSAHMDYHLGIVVFWFESIPRLYGAIGDPGYHFGAVGMKFYRGKSIRALSGGHSIGANP